jgi:hypothetical protein
MGIPVFFRFHRLMMPPAHATLRCAGTGPVRETVAPPVRSSSVIALTRRISGAAAPQAASKRSSAGARKASAAAGEIFPSFVKRAATARISVDVTPVPAALVLATGKVIEADGAVVVIHPASANGRRTAGVGNG